MVLKNFISKRMGQKKSEVVVGENLLILAHSRSGRTSKVCTCRNCKKMVNQEDLIQSENGDSYCSMECEEQAVIQDVYNVNKQFNLTEDETYFE